MTPLRSLGSLDEPNWPRMKNDLLGGKEAHDVDRTALTKAIEVAPDLAGFVAEEDGFLERTWRHLAARQGITQFVHAGAPLPVRRPPHWAGWNANAERGPVVYVEPDPVLAAKGRNDLEDHSMVTVLDGDIREPAALLNDGRLRGLIDFADPVAVILPSILDHVRAGRAVTILDELLRSLSPHSFVVATHALDPEYPQGTVIANELEARLRITLRENVAFRTKDEIEHLFDAWAELPPGVTRCGAWWPAGPVMRKLSVTEQLIVGVVAMPPP